MDHRHGHGYQCNSCEEFQRERIADALDGLLWEARQTQDILVVIARHLIGGMSPTEVQQAQAEAKELSLGLQRSREKLSAAVKSQSNP